MYLVKKKNIYIPLAFNKRMNKWSELLLGLILIIGSIFVAFYSQAWGAWNFWTAAGTFFKGGLFWFVLMIGVLFVLLGISDLKESNNHQSQPQQHQAPQPQASMNNSMSDSQSSPRPLRRKK